MLKVISVAIAVVGLMLVLYFLRPSRLDQDPQLPLTVTEKSSTQKRAATPKPVTESEYVRVAPTKWFMIESVEEFEKLNQPAEKYMTKNPERGKLAVNPIPFNEPNKTAPWVFDKPSYVAKTQTASAVSASATAPAAPSGLLTVKQQKAVFNELTLSEKKAAAEGLAHDPSYGETYQSHVQKLNSRYRDATRQKYGINQQQLEKVYRKGVNENWSNQI